MGFFKKWIQKTVIGGSLDLTGKLLGISNDSVFNPKPDPSVAAAKKAAEEAAAAAKAQQDAVTAAANQEKLALANMQANSLALSNANAANTENVLANVVAGGGADQVDTTKKRRLPVQSLASTLGINV